MLGRVVRNTQIFDTWHLRSGKKGLQVRFIDDIAKNSSTEIEQCSDVLCVKVVFECSGIEKVCIKLCQEDIDPFGRFVRKGGVFVLDVFNEMCRFGI